MYTQTSRYDRASNFPEAEDRTELIKAVVSLRKEVASITNNMQQMLKENQRLKQEMNRIHHRRDTDHRFSDIHRVKSEIDKLVDRYQTASQGRIPQQRRSFGESEYVSGSVENSAWAKKMMLIMMMAEFV